MEKILCQMCASRYIELVDGRKKYEWSVFDAVQSVVTDCYVSLDSRIRHSSSVRFRGAKPASRGSNVVLLCMCLKKGSPIFSQFTTLWILFRNFLSPNVRACVCVRSVVLRSSGLREIKVRKTPAPTRESARPPKCFADFAIHVITPSVFVCFKNGRLYTKLWS